MKTTSLYLLLFVVALFSSNYGTKAGLSSQALSFLTVRLEASANFRQQLGLSTISLESSYMSCLSDLSRAKSDLANKVSCLHDCENEEEDKRQAFFFQSSLCTKLKADYDRYCNVNFFKKGSFDKHKCSMLFEELRECFKLQRELGAAYNSKRRDCNDARNAAQEKEEVYKKVESKCSELEQRLYNSCRQTSLNVVDGDSLLDAPLHIVSASEVSDLQLLVPKLEAELRECLQMLEYLASRYSQKNLQFGGSVAELSDSKSRRKMWTRRRTGRPSVGEEGCSESADVSFKEQQSVVKDALFRQELTCRNIESKLRKAKGRLESAMNSQPSQGALGAGYLGRLRARISRAAGWFTSRIRSIGLFSRRRRDE